MIAATKGSSSIRQKLVLLEERGEKGGKPRLKEELITLHKIAKASIEARLDRLGMGNFGNCTPVGEAVYELKIYVGPGYRVYYAKVGKQIVLLLCGGSKRTQYKDIEKAKEYFKDYKSRGKDHGKKKY